MQKYSPHQIPLLSFFSDELYYDVGRNWQGTCLGYLFLLTAVCFIPFMAKIHTWYGDFADNVAPAIIIQLPELRIIDGELRFRAPQPYHIIDPETEQVVVVIDTTGEITSLDETTAPVLITKTGVLTRTLGSDNYTIAFNTLENTTIDQRSITDWLSSMRKLIIPVVYPVAVLGTFAYRVIELILYAAIGMLLASWNGATFSFQAVFRLAVVALTPSIVGNALLASVGITIPFGGLFFFMVTMGYLFFGIKVCIQPADPSSPENNSIGGDGTSG